MLHNLNDYHFEILGEIDKLSSEERRPVPVCKIVKNLKEMKDSTVYSRINHMVDNGLLLINKQVRPFEVSITLKGYRIITKDAREVVENEQVVKKEPEYIYRVVIREYNEMTEMYVKGGTPEEALNRLARAGLVNSPNAIEITKFFLF